MRSSRYAAVVLILVASSISCGGGGESGGGPGPDTTPPTVASTNPTHLATAVGTRAAITAIFSEAVDPATVSTLSFYLSQGSGAVAGSVGYASGTRTATFTPSSALLPSTQYTARIGGVKDTAGNTMAAAHVWSFETSPPAAGDLDPTFGTLGVTRTDVGGDDTALAMAIQADDKIVLAGGSGGAFAVVRYHGDGTLDETFGPGGIVTTAMGTCGAVARAVVIQGDGKIVAAGTCGGPVSSDIALARYQADGTLDPAFGASGIKVTGFTVATITANAVTVDASGNIVVAGMSDLNSTSLNSSDFVVARFTPAGALDTSFSGDGYAFVDFKPSSYTSGSALHDAAYAVTVEGDGRILVVGYAEDTAWLNEIALARLNSDGTSAGKVQYPFGSWWNDDARALALQPDGKIVVTGKLDTHYLGVMRFTSTLTPDTTFNTTGFVATDMRNDTSSSDDRGYAVTLQPDGKVVVAGAVRRASSPYPQDFALARYLANGALDTTFGLGGKVIADGGGADDALTGVARQSDGKLVVAGTSGGDFFVARYVP